ncbi:MAG: Eco57I restriction-modification methylase domain-containing protein [Elusimicrobiota bacterium]
MDKNAARQLIRKTFQNPFRKDSFVYFIKNLLNYIEDAPFIYRGNFIPDAFNSYIKTLERIGKYQDPEDKQIDILIVHLKKESSLEHARTMQRNFIAWYLNGSRGGKLKDAALVAFVAPHGKNWRFSLVKMEYKLGKTKTGRIRAKEKLTPARRYSFLVGINESSHTAQSRLVPILEDDINNPPLRQLEEAFNIEKVTKEFFEKYRELFHWANEELDKIVNKDPAIKRDFDKKDISTVDFTKKLLGQIVFLYFLQKKGWFGVKRGDEWGLGSRRFLRELFEKKHSDYKNFFNEILEPLFYEALRLERPGDYYSRFDCRIPFLNGGLFDPINDYDWWDTDIFLPDKIFSNKRKTKEGDIGDGILDVFDRYNFTVKEDEPLEKEVAVDPEMLGKVFENLLEIKDRKSKGTYYTPRGIVHYMCQESLANYLTTELEGKVSKEDIETLIKYGEITVEHDATYLEKTAGNGSYKGRYDKAKLPDNIRKHAKLIDEKLASIRVCDPAVGSGAFPVGMMNEVIRTRNALTPYIDKNGERTPYNFKRQAIQNCLYGVDIDPGAVEIAKLRLWLSLIVDEEDRDKIQPLPNLDYKIMQGNSLISQFMEIDFEREDISRNGQLLISQDDTDSLIEKLKNKKDEYLNKASASEKQKLKQEIEDLIITIFETKLKKQKADYFKRIKAMEEKYKNLPNTEQRESLIQAEKKKLYKISGFNLEQFEQQLREYTTGNKIRPFFPWRLYFVEVFHENKGFDVVIGNPPYVRMGIIKGLKSFLQKTYKVFHPRADLYCYFLELSFNISKPNGISTFISSNKYFRAGYGKLLRKLLSGKTAIKTIINFSGAKVFESSTVDTAIIIFQKEKQEQNQFSHVEVLKTLSSDNFDDFVQKHGILLMQVDLSDEGWGLLIPEFQIIMEKMRRAGTPLESHGVKVVRGIVSGAKNVFEIDEAQKNLFIKQNPMSKELIKPIVHGQNIKRWQFPNPKKYLLFIKRGVDIKKYPEIFGYLESHRDALERRVTVGVHPWYELQQPQMGIYEEFERERIIYPDIAEEPRFASILRGVYCDNTTYNLTTDSKFILAVLNSRLVDLFYRSIANALGNRAVRYFSQYVERIPIPKVVEKEQKPFIDLVNKILAITKGDDYLENTAKQDKVREYEEQIDQLVYKLYGLTQEEIKIVEGQNNDKKNKKN